MIPDRKLQMLFFRIPGQLCCFFVFLAPDPHGVKDRARLYPPQANPPISITALLELLRDADPEMKAKLRLALLT